MDICPCNICPGDICPYQQYLRYYWPDFDQILRVVPGTLYFNCNGHICPGNIGPGKICPYHEYFSCYLDTIFEGRDFFWSKYFWTTFSLTETQSWEKCWGVPRAKIYGIRVPDVFYQLRLISFSSLRLFLLIYRLTMKNAALKI